EKGMAKALQKLEKALAKMDIAELAVAQAQASGMGGAEEKENINGGKPSEGIDPGFKGTFVFGITGTDLDMLNINSFLALLSEGKSNEAGSEGFIVRFQGVGTNGEGSDYAPPDGEFPPQNIPEPATLLLLGTGLAHLAGFGRKRLRKA
ncbi:MAG: PEP-CTERM sorting domain-containing protein, partial [Deltaproteobacteria bacterium]|nr:PEP-CTERM sorting domain-containing protein [Deltaproteobacteria bacterium]